MNKMRENTGVILWILVIAFGVIWTLQDSGGLDTVGQQGNEIIVVDGDAVTVQEYNQAVQSQMQRAQQQTGEALSPQRRDMVREQVYSGLVADRLREHEMDRLGITVTDDEVYDMVLGENPHPIIKQQFGDGQGGVDRALLQNFIENPEARQQWIQIEDFLRTQRRREKLNNIMEASVHVSEQDVRETYIRRNKKADAQYVALRYAAVPNDSVQVTERDLRDFYERQREDFKRKRSYTLNYATLSKNATPEDTAAVREEVEGLRSDFAAAENDSMFLARNASAQPYTSDYLGPNDLRDEVAAAVFDNPEPGQMVGPITAGDQVHLVKIKDVRPAETPVVRARHILLRTSEDDAEAQQQARQQVQDLKQRLQSGDATFAELARQYSEDGTSSRGGDLGWFGRDQMVEPFTEAAFDAEVGAVVGPVETQFGYHLIKVTGRSDQEVQVADYALDVRPDQVTLRNIQDKLADLSYYTGESGNFQQEAQRLNLDVQEVQVEEDQQAIPSIGRSNQLQDFLEQSEAGAVSDVIELDDQYLVAYVDQIQEAGYRPFEEVKNELRPRVQLEKKRAIQMRRLRQAFDQRGFAGLAQAVGTQQRTAAGITLAEPVIQGLGREPKFVGTAMGLDEGQVSDVIEGENAAYVLKTTRIQEPPELTDAKRKKLRAELTRQRRREIRSGWIATLRENADITDNRSRFRQ